MITDQGIFGLARTGTIDDRIRFPAILQTGTHEGIEHGGNFLSVAGRRVDLPDVMRADNSQWHVDSSGEIVVIPDAINLLQRPRKLISRILEIRKESGFRPLIYAPGVGDPYLLPALFYAGISIFDDLFIRAESLNKVMYTTLGRAKSHEDPFKENIAFSGQILDSLSESVSNLTTREVVEKYTISSRSIEIMRILDTEFYDIIEPLYPLRTPYIKANSVESMYRPDLNRYRHYVSKSYVRNPEKNIALLLPCTARKPYSASKTHRKIFSYIGKFAPHVHKIVVTSPVGMVPEELEETYPPAFYDIPTIGTWFEDEKKMIMDMANDYFSRNMYSGIVAFITPDLSFIQDALPEGSEIIQGDIRSEKMLHELSERLAAMFRSTDSKRKVNPRVSKLKSIASYQFGSWIEPYIDGMKLVRSYNQDMFMKEGKAMLVYNQKAGRITVTKEMGKIFIKENKFVVQIDDFKPTANVYAMGIRNATEDIRQESEVVLEYNGEFRGVGVARMPYRYMHDLQKGTAVKVRN